MNETMEKLFEIYKKEMSAEPETDNMREFSSMLELLFRDDYEQEKEINKMLYATVEEAERAAYMAGARDVGRLLLDMMKGGLDQ